MQPYQSQLFSMSMYLIGCMFLGSVPTAWLLRNVNSRAIAVGSFILTIIMLFAVIAVSSSQNPLPIAFASMVFGASLGATLGSFTVAVTRGRRRGAEAVALTLGLVAIATMSAAFIGMFSGFNWQSIGGIMFSLLLLLVVGSIVMVFVRLGRTAELVVAGLSCVFWFIYLVYDFNRIVDRYTEATWPAAAEIAMNVYLDMVNLFIRLLPIMVELLEAMD